jgi:hypothetical protein
MRGSVFSTDFILGDRVNVDCGDIIAVVVGFCFYARGTQVQVSWWNSGTLTEQWIDEARLRLKGNL